MLESAATGLKGFTRMLTVIELSSGPAVGCVEPGLLRRAASRVREVIITTPLVRLEAGGHNGAIAVITAK
jgi:hypothetical protein